MAIVENQMVEVKWTNNYQKYYIDKGYNKRKPGEIFLVRVSDLKASSNKEVKVICDYCGKLYYNKLSHLNKSKTHTCSGVCLGQIERKNGNRKSYSKDELKNYYFKYYEEFGIYPLLKDLIKTKGYPGEKAYKSYWKTYLDFLKEINMVRQDSDDGWFKHDETVLREKYHNESKEDIIDSLLVKRTWSSIVSKARKLGLTRNRNSRKSKYDDEYLITCLKNYYKETGKIPGCAIFDDPSNDYPSWGMYRKRFGSWNKALKLADLQITRHFDFNKDDIKKEAIDFFNKHNRSPYYYELSFSRTAVSKYYIHWADMLKDAGLPINVKVKKSYNKNELVEVLKEYVKEFDKIPSSLDIENHYRIGRQHFTNKFGYFRQGLFEAGLINADEIHIDYDEYLINNIINLRKLASDLDRIPSVQEYEEYINEFPKSLSRRNLSERMNLTYSEICEKFLPHTILFNPNNNFLLNKQNYKCKSNPEVLISNLFIDNNLDFSYENYYKEFINIKENYKLDWVVYHNNKKYLVEYFGYFKEEEKEYSLVLNYTSKAKLKMDICKRNGLTLIDLYSQDIENNFSGLASKFYSHGIFLNTSLIEAI